jgi:hypothetical protein
MSWGGYRDVQSFWRVWFKGCFQEHRNVQQRPARLMTRQISIIEPPGLSYLHGQAIPYQVVAVLVVVGRVVGSWLECAARWGAQLGGVGRYTKN